MGRKATDPIGKELFMIVLRNGIAFFDSSKRVQYPQNLVELSFKCSYKVSEVSRELGISSRQLERMFHAALGLTPKAWMREQRMVRARQLIREGCSLKSIALLLGFKRYSHFNTEIQVYYGMSPTRLVSSEKSLCFDSERQFA